MPIPLRSIRVSDALWCAAQETATREGSSVSAVIVRSLERYVERHPAPTVAERAQAKRRKRLRELMATDPAPSEEQVQELVRLIRS